MSLGPPILQLQRSRAVTKALPLIRMCSTPCSSSIFKSVICYAAPFFKQSWGLNSTFTNFTYVFCRWEGVGGCLKYKRVGMNIICPPSESFTPIDTQGCMKLVSGLGVQAESCPFISSQVRYVCVMQECAAEVHSVLNRMLYSSGVLDLKPIRTLL